ncbi:MAG: hypothetical protein RI953_512 [Pseudomonadota bacterium]|jgi:hypothetical protein
MRSVSKYVAFAVVALLITACGRGDNVRKNESLAHLSSTRAAPAKKTACVSFQGNGVYFSSHIGALIALLENNYEPVFATGGSSGAIIAGLARALVENPSLADGRGFSPQEAAVVLAASAPVIESVLFLPRFTTPLLLLDSLDVFLTGSSMGVLSAEPNDGLVNAESIVGQSTLVIDFYRTADFSEIFSMGSVREREFELARMWKKYANTVDVTPEDAADALLTSRETLEGQGRADLVEIQDRIFKLYRSKKDTFHRNWKTQQDSWNRLIGGNAKAFGLDSRERRQSIFKTLVEKMRALESFDALAATLSGQFMLADPDRVYRAFEGFDSRTNRRIEIPTNTIIHSTARRAKKVDGDWHENKGIGSLHQVYFSNPAQTPAFADRLLRPEHNPMRPSDEKLQPLVPSERIVVASMPLGPTLATTTGEPTAFLRYPIDLDVPNRLRLGMTSINDGLIGFGGWLEKVSLGTARQFEACAANNVDAYLYTSDGDGVSRFAKMILLGMFLDVPLRGLLAKQIEHPTDINALLSGNTVYSGITTGDMQSAFDNAVDSADRIFTDSRVAKGRVGNIPVNLIFASPSEVKGPAAANANIAIRSNRRAMVLAAYEYTRRVIVEQKIHQSTLNLWNLSGDRIKLLPLENPADILSLVNQAVPRLAY